MADDETIEVLDLVNVRVRKADLPPVDWLAPDPEPFGPSSAKPRDRFACRAVSLRPYPGVDGPAGHITKFTMCIETADRTLELSIDERSARFVLGCLATYLPFQSLGKVGTPSADAAKPST